MHRQPRRNLHSILAAAWLFAASVSAAHGQNEDLQRAIDAIAAEAMQSPGAVGLSIAVGRGDEVILAEGYGMVELEHSVPARPDTMLRIGSVTKQYTAAAIMKLVEDGKLDLDEPMTTFFPDFPLGDAVVTIRHLLTHTSGIKSYTGVQRFWEEGVSRELTVEQLLAYVRDEPLEFAPGEQYKYNNTAYYMLGPIIEQVSGVPYDEFLSNTFFEPLGLDRTRYDSNTELIRGRAQGYGVADGKLSNDRLIGMANPGAAGGLIASAHDLVKWQMALVNGDVVNAESYEQMTTPFTLNNGSSTNYGYGLSIGEFEGRRTVSHGGGIFGFNAMLRYFPDEDLHVAVISNSEGVDSGSIAQRIQRAALGMPEQTIADNDIPEAMLDRLVGSYLIEQVGLLSEVIARDGQIFVQPVGQGEFRLQYQGGSEFRATFDKNVRFVFELGEGDAPAQSITVHQGGQAFVAVRENQ